MQPPDFVKLHPRLVRNEIVGKNNRRWVQTKDRTEPDASPAMAHKQILFLDGATLEVPRMAGLHPRGLGDQWFDVEYSLA